MARRITLEGTLKTLFVKVKNAASSTTLTVLDASTTKIPQIHGLVVSTDTAGTYTLKIGSVEVLDFYLGANSGYGEKFHPLYISNETANEAITLVKPSGATTSCSLWYSLELSV